MYIYSFIFSRLKKKYSIRYTHTPKHSLSLLSLSLSPPPFSLPPSLPQGRPTRLHLRPRTDRAYRPAAKP